MTTPHNVVEDVCPDCDGHRYVVARWMTSDDPIFGPMTMPGDCEPCARCHASGWIEVYRYANDATVEIPDPARADRSRRGADARIPGPEIENTLPVPRPGPDA